MNKLTKALIHEVAVQGRKKAHWDKVYQVFGVQETRTSWQDWIKYKELIDNGFGDTAYQIRGRGYGPQGKRARRAGPSVWTGMAWTVKQFPWTRSQFS